MSPKPYPIFVVSAQDKPEQIEAGIRLLVRLYLIQHEKMTAKAVVMHINALLSIPKYINDIETRCQYRQLAEHWRRLAWIDC
ncbi:MAG: hypothetical protein KAH20_03310 [Methylococcales bacterium]|nr:hypothetical protein [Methylococcales bacterium]